MSPNGSSIASHTFTQLHNKVPIGYNCIPLIQPQNCLFTWGDHTHLLASSLDSANPPPQMVFKWHLGPISYFSQSTVPTNWLTDGLGYIACTNTRLCSIDCGDAANNNMLTCNVHEVKRAWIRGAGSCQLARRSMLIVSELGYEVRL